MLQADNKTNKINNLCSRLQTNEHVAAFLKETSIHTLHFFSQEKRQPSERIFWFISFLLSVIGASFLIYEIWDRYENAPVIVTFQSEMQSVSSIPFPAVTFCDMNKYPGEPYEKLVRRVKYGDDNVPADVYKQLDFIRGMCTTQYSFMKKLGFEDRPDFPGNIFVTNDSLLEMMDFLLETTIPCDQLIRRCVMGETVLNCSKIFQPVITDFGKCCTFNMLPLPLLLKNPNQLYSDPMLGKHPEKYWTQNETKAWETWHYDESFLLSTPSPRPRIQKRPGMPYGLSVVLHPNTELHACNKFLSGGVRFTLHNPLELPHVLEFGSVADTWKEVIVKVHPDVTNAGADIKGILPNKRKCYFGGEHLLRFFQPYTVGNCLEECAALVLGIRCNCTPFFMKRNINVGVCNSQPDSQENTCITSAMENLQATLEGRCDHCQAQCRDVRYSYETTVVQMRDDRSAYTQRVTRFHSAVADDPRIRERPTVVHIFFAEERVAVKIRNRLYGPTDLIAYIGGILGLCVGFSILSGIEVLYFLTLRPLSRLCKRGIIAIKTRLRTKSRKRVVQLAPRIVNAQKLNEICNLKHKIVTISKQTDICV